jgi:DNA-binding NtrC family response regulator
VAESKPTRNRVLIVDCYEGWINSLRAELRHAEISDAQVSRAYNDEAALRLVAKNDVAVVICDIRNTSSDDPDKVIRLVKRLRSRDANFAVISITWAWGNEDEAADLAHYHGVTHFINTNRKGIVWQERLKRILAMYKELFVSAAPEAPPAPDHLCPRCQRN